MLKSETQASSTKSSNLIIGSFLLVWIVLNLIQAATVELHADEAYYWLYSKFLAWGYFDHPPMVALYIKAGDIISHSLWGLRLASILSTAGAIYILWLTVKDYAENAKMFVLLLSCFILFHVYGFITTPDTPLFLFSALFFYLYKRYVEKDSWQLAAWLAVVIALMLYSKYHGVLILFFTILSNLKILGRKSFWLIVVLSLILFVPHILWQINNDYPSIQFHLFDRSTSPYRWQDTTDYLLSQLLIAGPMVLWIAYKSKFFKSEGKDLFIRAAKFNIVGIFVFFLFSSLKDDVEPHWTLIAYPPIFFLCYIYLAKLKTIPGWFPKLAIFNIVLVLLARMIFIIPLPIFQNFKIVRKQTGNAEWAKQVKQYADDSYIIFNEGFQEPSKYAFYNNTLKAFSYNSRNYRKNQFDLFPIEDSLRNKRVYYIQRAPFETAVQDSFETTKGKHYGIWLDSVRLYQKVRVDEEGTEKEWRPNEVRRLKLSIYNPYNEEINFKNEGERWKCYFEYAFIEKGETVEEGFLGSDFNKLRIAPGGKAQLTADITAPEKPGKYKLIFSIRTEPFSGSRNSRMIPVNVTDQTKP